MTAGAAIYAEPGENDRDREKILVAQCVALEFKALDDMAFSRGCRVPDAPSKHGDGVTVAWANAELIAKSPELLARLQAIDAAFDSAQHHGHSVPAVLYTAIGDARRTLAESGWTDPQGAFTAIELADKCKAALSDAMGNAAAESNRLHALKRLADSGRFTDAEFLSVAGLSPAAGARDLEWAGEKFQRAKAAYESHCAAFGLVAYRTYDGD